ncbi:MAG: hypothetical protein H0W88_07985 [Parachlamydiaceae bacterium]|nr:hypothetical protein [Parachlamydiaceae bacterium]
MVAINISRSNEQEFINLAHKLGTAAKHDGRFKALDINTLEITKQGIVERFSNYLGIVGKKQQAQNKDLEIAMTTFYKRAITVLAHKSMNSTTRSEFLNDLIAIDDRLKKVKSHVFSSNFKKIQVELEDKLIINQNELLNKQSLDLLKEVHKLTGTADGRRNNGPQLREKIGNLIKQENDFFSSGVWNKSLPPHVRNQQKLRVQLLTMTFISTFPVGSGKKTFTDRERLELAKLDARNYVIDKYISRFSTNLEAYSKVRSQLHTQLPKLEAALTLKGDWGAKPLSLSGDKHLALATKNLNTLFTRSDVKEFNREEIVTHAPRTFFS